MSQTILNGQDDTLDAHGTPVVLRFDLLNVTGLDCYASATAGALTLGYPRTFLASMQFRF